MAKKRTKWSIKPRLAKQQRRKETMRTLVIVGMPYVLAEMYGRPPKIPQGYPPLDALAKMTLEQLKELEPVLQQFLQETGGLDLDPGDRLLLDQLRELNPRSLRIFGLGTS